MDQDSTGLMWLGTYNGLASFDGYSFQNYNSNDGLIANHISAICIDSKGRMWLGTWSNGFQVFQGAKFDKENCEKAELKYSRVAAIREDPDGNIWVCLNYSLLKVKIDANDSIIILDKIDHKIAPTDMQISNDQIWISSIRNGLVKIDLKTKNLEVLNTDNGLGNNICYGIYTEEETIWIGHYGGLSRFDKGQFISYTLPGNFDANRVYTISRINDSIFELGTYGNGVLRWNINSSTTLLAGKKSGIEYPFVQCHLNDKENNNWYGTDGSGFYKVRSWTTHLENEFPEFSDEDLTAIYLNEAGEEYLAFYDKGVLHRKNNVFINSYGVKEGLINPYIHIIQEDEDKIYFGGTGGLYELSNNVVKRVQAKCGNGTLNDRINSLMLSNSKIYSSTRANIIALSDTSCREYKIPLKTEGWLLLPFKENAIYGCVSGLYILDLEKGEFKRINNSKKEQIFCGIQDSFGNYWFGSQENLIFYNPLKDSIRYFNGFQYFDENVFGSFYEYKKKLYMSVGRSLREMDLDSFYENGILLNRRLDEIDHLASKNLSLLPWAISARKDMLFLGTSNGLLHYDLSKETIHTKPELILKNIKTDKNIFSNLSETVILDYNESNITFNYQAIYLSDPNKLQCRYRMIGLDEKWKLSKNNLAVNYEILPPGEYEFQIQAGIIANWDNAVSLKIPFSIKSPFYQTIWFWILSFVGFAVLLSVIARWRIHQLKNRISEKEKYARDLIKSIDQERKRIARDLHDGVAQSLILAKEQVKSEKKGAGEFVQKAIEEIRYTSRNIHPAQLEHSGITASIEELIKTLNDATDIIFTEDIQNIDAYLSEDQQLQLFRFIQEACNNIIKHSGALSARLTTKLINKHRLELAITDNGRGFEKDKPRNSLGLKTMQERALIMKAELIIQSDKKGTSLTLIFNQAKKV